MTQRTMKRAVVLAVQAGHRLTYLIEELMRLAIGLGGGEIPNSHLEDPSFLMLAEARLREHLERRGKVAGEQLPQARRTALARRAAARLV